MWGKREQDADGRCGDLHQAGRTTTGGFVVLGSKSKDRLKGLIVDVVAIGGPFDDFVQ